MSVVRKAFFAGRSGRAGTPSMVKEAGSRLSAPLLLRPVRMATPSTASTSSSSNHNSLKNRSSPVPPQAKRTKEQGLATVSPLLAPIAPSQSTTTATTTATTTVTPSPDASSSTSTSATSCGSAVRTSSGLLLSRVANADLMQSTHYALQRQSRERVTSTYLPKIGLSSSRLVPSPVLTPFLRTGGRVHPLFDASNTPLLPQLLGSRDTAGLVGTTASMRLLSTQTHRRQSKQPKKKQQQQHSDSDSDSDSQLGDLHSAEAADTLVESMGQVRADIAGLVDAELKEHDYDAQLAEGAHLDDQQQAFLSEFNFRLSPPSRPYGRVALTRTQDNTEVHIEFESLPDPNADWEDLLPDEEEEEEEDNDDEEEDDDDDDDEEEHDLQSKGKQRKRSRGADLMQIPGGSGKVERFDPAQLKGLMELTEEDLKRMETDEDEGDDEFSSLRGEEDGDTPFDLHAMQIRVQRTDPSSGKPIASLHVDAAVDAYGMLQLIRLQVLKEGAATESGVSDHANESANPRPIMFADLKPELQQAMYNYLQCLGVSDLASRFVADFVLQAVQRQQLDTLAELKKFIVG